MLKLIIQYCHSYFTYVTPYIHPAKYCNFPQLHFKLMKYVFSQFNFFTYMYTY